MYSPRSAIPISFGKPCGIISRATGISCARMTSTPQRAIVWKISGARSGRRTIATAYKIYDVSEKLLSKQADQIITVSESVKTRFPEAEIIYNVPKEVNEWICEKVSHSLVHVGGLGMGRGIDKLLYSLKEIQNVYPDTTLTILGGFNDSGNFAENYIKENNLNVNIINWVDYDKIHEYLDKCQIGIILFQRGVYNTEIGLPNKLFEYMNSRCAVVASDFVEIRRVVNSSNCGVLVDPANVTDITDKILKLFENEKKILEMGNRGHSAILNKYNWDKEEKKLLKCVNLVSGKSYG